MRTDKLAKLMQRADKGRAFAEFAHDQNIQEFFDATEDRIVNDIADGSKTLTSDELRALAVALDTTRTIRAFIRDAAAGGLRAEKEYAKLAGDQNHA